MLLTSKAMLILICNLVDEQSREGNSLITDVFIYQVDRVLTVLVGF